MSKLIVFLLTTGMLVVATFATGSVFAAPCAQLARALTGTEVTLSATPQLVTRTDLPRFCQVRGTIAGRIGFEMRLPLEHWNGKFLMAGCGGYCGKVLPDKPGYANTINPSLKRGYAVIAQDGGHESASNANTDWAREDPGAYRTWAYRVVPQVVAASRRIIGAFYGKPPRYSYYSGCSNGGRLGLIAAQRYPDLFDGIASGAGVFDLAGNAGINGSWLIQQAKTADGHYRFAPQQIARLEATVVRQCDRLDGVADGVVANPNACKVDLKPLACKAGTHKKSCFSAAELDHVRAMYRGVVAADGKVLFPGLPPGSEHYWPFWLTGNGKRPAWGLVASQGFLDTYRGMPSKQHIDGHMIDSVAEASAMRASPGAQQASATDPDLRPLARAGTKLLIWHGWADALISPRRMIAYYREAEKVTGQARLRGTARLFMVPGDDHCWDNSGLIADIFDPVKVLEGWVEHGHVPTEIVTRDAVDPAVAKTSRLLCSWPQQAIYRGHGPIDRASSYQCGSASPDAGPVD